MLLPVFARTRARWPCFFFFFFLIAARHIWLWRYVTEIKLSWLRRSSPFSYLENSFSRFSGKDEISRFKFWSESLSSTSTSTYSPSYLYEMLERYVSFFGRIDRARVILRRDRKSSSKSAVKLLGVTNGHRGIFIVRENQFSTDRRRFQTRLEDSRRISLSARNDSRPLSNRNYRSNSR